ncbi:AMP-binding enzyme protein [Rutstroemia sp. NJR-2017a WRK4]|nr:AMP-binding enzyme protein [Rutstroemia sp. NJR-2017a WRK4]
MVFLAEKKVTIPTKDLLSWTFDDVPYNQDDPIYIDAAKPSRSISANQARVIIRKLVAGIIAAGGIFAGTNPSYTPHELVHHIKTSHTKFLITEPEMLDSALSAAKECSIPPSNIWIFDVLDQDIPSGFRSFKELMNHGEKDWVRFDDEKTSKETTAARLFSSGTTGLPKAAMLSHYNLIAEHVLVFEQVPKPFITRRLLALPMFHAACVPGPSIAPYLLELGAKYTTVAHTSALKGGHVSIIMRRFELTSFLNNAQKYQVNELSLVPPIIIAIIMSGLAGDKLRSVQLVGVGAAPLGAESQAKLKALCAPGACVNQVWGMTETSCVGSMFYYGEDDTTGSIGRMMPNIDAK